MLYRTRIPWRAKGTLDIGEARDYVVIYINGHRVGTLDRRLNQHELSIDVPGPTARLDILVEDTGRVNYGPRFPTDHKGLVLHRGQFTLSKVGDTFLD